MNKVTATHLKALLAGVTLQSLTAAPSGPVWVDMTTQQALYELSHEVYQIRAKPSTVTINGEVLAGPLRRPPAERTMVWLLSFNECSYAIEWAEGLTGALESGLLFANREDAEAMAAKFRELLK